MSMRGRHFYNSNTVTSWNSKTFWNRLILILPLLVLVYSVSLHFLRDVNDSLKIPMDAAAEKTTATEASSSSSSSSPTYSVAHIGNSIQYYNDCPRLLEKMLLATALGRVVDLENPQRKRMVRSDSCLKGGSTLPSLWEEGNGMAKKFSSRPESMMDGKYDTGLPTVADLLQPPTNDNDNDKRYWDFFVINDHTQSPVREERKEASKTVLENDYLPAIAKGMEATASNSSNHEGSGTTIVFVQTMAYKTPVKNSADLGTFDEFTEKLQHGYDEYVALVKAYAAARFPHQPAPPLTATVAPLGRAYQIIHETDLELWSTTMYANDDFHPSPHGTLLEACLLHCVITGGQKFAFWDTDEEDSMDEWWKRARYMQPPTYPNGDPQEPLRLPTREEAVRLNDIAYQVYLEHNARQGEAKKSNL